MTGDSDGVDIWDSVEGVRRLLTRRLLYGTKLSASTTKVLSFALEAQGCGFQDELREALHRNDWRSEIAVRAIELSQQEALSGDLIQVAGEAEASGHALLWSLAVRALGFVGGKLARDYLVTACERYLAAEQTVLLRTTACSVAGLYDPESGPLLVRLLQEAESLPPFGDSNLVIKSAAAMGLAGLGEDEGHGWIHQALHPAAPSNVRSTAVQLLPRLAVPSKALVRSACVLFLEGPRGVLDPLLTWIQIATGAEASAYPRPSASGSVTSECAAEIVRVTATEVLSKGATERHCRALLLLQSVDSNRAESDVIQEAHQSDYGLATLARQSLMRAQSLSKILLPALPQQFSSSILTVPIDTGLIESVALRAKVGDRFAEGLCIGLLTAVARCNWHAVGAETIERTVSLTGDLRLCRVLTGTPRLSKFALAALTPESCQAQSRVIRQLFLTSRRDVRLYCTRALLRGGLLNDLEWLKQRLPFEPSPDVRTVITASL